MSEERVTYASETKYFFSTEYPHKWGSGPVMNQWNMSTGDYIQSLEEAKAIAESHAVGGYGESRCTTTYGVLYKVDEQKAHAERLAKEKNA